MSMIEQDLFVTIMRFKLNTGKVISGNIKYITFLNVVLQNHPASIVMQFWKREARSAYTKAMHGGYFVKIHLSTSISVFSKTHYDWCDKQMEFSEWINSHKI